MSRVTLSEWEKDALTGAWQQAAEGPNGKFYAVVADFENVPGVLYEIGKPAKRIATIGYHKQQVVKGNATTLLLALAGQPTDAERRVLDAARGLPDHAQGLNEESAENVLRTWAGRLSYARDKPFAAAVHEFIDARDALLAEDMGGDA